MKKLFIKGFMAFNKFLIRISGGRMGTQMRTQRVFILHTIGRKTGQQRAVPISYFSDGDSFFVVGSNWGQKKNASWYFNLKENPHATLEVSGEKISVVAHEAEGDEYARLWQIAVEKNPPYEEYKKNAGRHLPIIVFKPVS